MPCDFPPLFFYLEYYVFGKLATLLSLYGLALYRGRFSPISLARDSGGLQNLFQGILTSLGSVYNFLIRYSLDSFSGSRKLLFLLCLQCCRLSGATAASKPTPLFLGIQNMLAQVPWISWDRNQAFGQPPRKKQIARHMLHSSPFYPMERLWVGWLLPIVLSHASLWYHFRLSGVNASCFWLSLAFRGPRDPNYASSISTASSKIETSSLGSLVKRCNIGWTFYSSFSFSLRLETRSQVSLLTMVSWIGLGVERSLGGKVKRLFLPILMQLFLACSWLCPHLVLQHLNWFLEFSLRYFGPYIVKFMSVGERRVGLPILQSINLMVLAIPDTILIMRLKRLTKSNKWVTIFHIK